MASVNRTKAQISGLLTTLARWAVEVLEPRPAEGEVDLGRAFRLPSSLGRPAGRLLVRVVQPALRVRQWRFARLAALTCVRFAPDEPASWIALSCASRLGSVEGIANDPVRGLVQRPVGDCTTARAAAHRAVALDPEAAHALNELGNALAWCGDALGATDALERSLAIEPHQADTLFSLARLEAAKAAKRGFFTSAEFERHTELAAAALAQNPRHGGARYHLVRVAIRNADWHTAADAAVERRDLAPIARSLAEVDSTDRAVAALMSAIRGTALPADALVVAFWRLQSIGAYRSAFEIKDLLAEQLIKTTNATGLFDVTTTVRALTTLGRFGEAMTLLRLQRRRFRGPRSRSALAKLEADVSYLDGDLARHQAYPIVTNGPAERQFEQLIRGRSIAVVGPLTTGSPPQLEDFDVIIRTKHLGGEAQTRQPVVAYFANAGAQLFRTEIADALATGGLDLAVTRPSMIDIDPGVLRQPRVRVAPSENAALLEASQYGIPRAVYDVLRYEPRHVCLFNADFFAGGRRYDPDYQRERSHGLSEAVVGYGHDVRADHRTMARLLERGVIDASAEVKEVLNLSTDAYLDCLTDNRSTEPNVE